MLPLDTLSLFIAASTALALAPGPDNIFVLTQSALHGPRAGLSVVLGLCSGLAVHTGALALGVAALFAASATAFNVLKVIGALYLLYLAWQAFRADATPLPAEGAPGLGFGKLYRRGVIMNVTNPKVAIFFLAFLPQFTDPAWGALPMQFVLLGVVFSLVTLMVFGAIAWLAGGLAERFRRSGRTQLTLNRIAGTVFATLAIKLFVSER